MIFAAIVSAVPWLFALIRGFSAGDWRYLWVALASFLGARLVGLVSGRIGPKSTPTIGRLALAFVMSTLFGCAAGFLLGVSLGPAMLIVAAAFGACSAAGLWRRRAGATLSTPSQT